ncbi:MAG: histidinol-phosphate aminotransferase family protein [Saprospiraceae bacterium]|nr:histidinol-phosphate aminotransferase family protein [Saprospiraceae bacterium]
MKSFFNDYLLAAKQRISDVNQKYKLLLDKNEQTIDIDLQWKEMVLDELRAAHWNRYPDADHSDIESKIADYCGLKRENIVLSPGSASIITTLLNYFALNRKSIFITQPSYSLFDYHCKTYNIQYQPWFLTDKLEYAYDRLPELGKNSVLIITSPNNPVGNSFDINYLEFLLNLYPESMIIVDAVYCEFGNVDYTPLVMKYKNLIVLRSFSKAFPVAGLRLGYLCAAPETTAALKKLFLQFSISYFSLIFARKMLFTPEFMELSAKRVKAIIKERNLMYEMLQSDEFKNVLYAYPSQGNFLLIKVYNEDLFSKLAESLASNGIKVLNANNFSMLENTFRVSIGTPKENQMFLEILKNIIDNIIQSKSIQAQLLTVN